MPPLPSDGHGLDLTPYFTKYFLKYFLLGPHGYVTFMPDPASAAVFFHVRPMRFLSLSSTDPAFNLALEECLLQWLPADHPGLFLLCQNAPSVIV